MKISYYLDRPNIEKGKETFIVCSLSLNGWNLKMSTKIYLKPSDVNLEKDSKTKIRSIKTGVGAGKDKEGNTTAGYKLRLDNFEDKLRHFINTENNGGLSLTKEQVRQEIRRIISPAKFGKNTMLLQIYREYLESYNSKNVELDTKVTKRSMYRQLENYLKNQKPTKSDDYDVPIAEFNTRKFFEQFTKYLRGVEVKTKKNEIKKLSVNYIAKIITDLRSFGRWAADPERKYIDELIGNVEIETEEAIKVALSYQEIDMIYNHVSDDLALNEVRDTFVFQCLTGLRYSDLKQLVDRANKTARFDLTSNIIRLTTKKTDTDIVIPIQPRLQALLERREYNLNFIVKDLFTYNKSLKKLCKEVGLNEDADYMDHSERGRRIKEKWELVYSHTARRSYITNLMRAGMHDEFIRRTTGHKNLDSFRKYVKLDADDLKDVFAKLL